MRKRIFLMLVITFALCQSLYAAPALPRLIEITQPDGSIIKARQQGDEFQHWTETKNGYTILHNPRTKYWEYAEQDANDRLKSSGYRALGQEFVPTHIPPRLKPPRNKKLELYRQKSLNKTYQERLKGAALTPSSSAFAPSPSVQRAAVGDWTPMPVAGERKLLLVLINFSDRILVIDSPDWESTVFSLDPTDKSVARYFAENSFSALNVSPADHRQTDSPPGIIAVSISAPHPYPSGDRDPNESYATEPGILNLALTQAATDVDFRSFDADNSGTLEQSELVIYFIYAGYEASGSDKIPSVWAHAWGESGVTAGGLAVTDWAISGELNDAGRQQTMGIIAHELGHALCGLPDLYDTSYTNAGMGIFSLMAAGGWGADSSEDDGTTPTNLDLWSREYLGWATAAEPGAVNAITIHPSLSAPDSGYKLQTPVSDSEYYLLENRHPAGWDLGAKFALGASWQGGLLLTHIDITAGTSGSNDINNFTSTGGRQGVSPVQASTEICDMLTADCWGSEPTLFYADNNSSWTPVTAPDSNYYDGQPTNFSLTAISPPLEAMTATWSTAPVPPVPVIEDFESGDLSKLPWLTSGNGNWSVTASGYNSIYAAEAPTTLNDSQQATLQTTVVTGAGALSFRYAVDSEAGWDYLIFSIDGVEKGRWSGLVNWSRAVYALEAGTHTLTWTYEKDEGVSSVLDTAWIDDLSFPAPYDQSIMTIDFSPAFLTINATTTASAAATSGLPVTLTSITPATCTISGSTVTGIAAGTCTIVANQVGDSNYNAATPISQNITVGKANQSLAEITFPHPILPLNGFTTASTTASSGLDVTWFSFTPSVCTFANDNTINGIAPGTCTITANQIGDTNYNSAPPISQDIPVVKVYVYDGYETTAADALFALQMAIRKRSVDLSADLAPLINRIPAPDGKVTAADALVILRKAVGLW